MVNTQTLRAAVPVRALRLGVSVCFGWFGQRRSRPRLLAFVALLGCCVGSSAVSPLSALGDEVIIAGERHSAPTVPQGATSANVTVTQPAAVGQSASEAAASPSPTPLEADVSLSSSPGGEFLIPSLEPAVEAEQIPAPTDSQAPAAVQRRDDTGTSFAHLGPTEAAQVAREAFPSLIGRQVGGPPPLPPGQEVVRYLAPNTAQLSLPGGKHAIIESTQPMATETATGHLAPVDLSLNADGDVFESARPVVGAIIPERLSEGVQLPERDVSLTPVDDHGAPLEGAGAIDGASVLYANTQPDMDTAVKPTTEGIEASAILRSIESPTTLYFKLALPPGASLVQAADGAGPARIMLDGQTLATIKPPSARDAQGVSVPVSMTAVGDLLTLTVSSKGANYQWPIAVDPEIVAVDRGIGPTECHKNEESEHPTSNWCWFANPGSSFTHQWNAILNGRGVGILVGSVGGALVAGNYAGIAYHTQGTSKIFKLEAETAGWNFKRSEARLELAEKRSTEVGSVENKATIEKAGVNPVAWENRWTTVTSAGTPENVAAFKLEALETNVETHFEAAVDQLAVYIEQETSPEVSFNESESTIDSGRPNVLYNSSSGAEWLSPTQGAFEVKAKDRGIGISEAQVTIGSFHQTFPFSAEGKCNGAQCNEEYHSFLTYNPSMPEGEPTLEWAAENFADYQECLNHTVPTAR